MSVSPAIRAALDLYNTPPLVREVRAAPLPAEMEPLLLLVAGDEAALKQAEDQTARPRDTLVNAAAFFVEQILLDPDADHFRVLGANRSASTADLRKHMALIMRWLHPDMDPDGDRSVFATRVIRAWQVLKTPERRAAYEQQLDSRQTRNSRQGQRPGSRSTGGHVKQRTKIHRPGTEVYLVHRPGPIRRLFLALLGAQRRR